VSRSAGSLQRPGRAPYLRDMGREATNFEIAEIHISHAPDAAVIRTGLETGAPSPFTAHVVLTRPSLLVQMDVRLHKGGVPQIIELRMQPNNEPTITSGALRGVALDRLLRDVLREAESPVENLPEFAPNAYRLPGDKSDVFRVGVPAKSRVQQRGDAMAARAAEIYKQAVAHGSQAPAAAVATEMDRSRGQAARYIRRARELGLLPQLDGTVTPQMPPGTEVMFGGRDSVLSESFKAKVDEATLPAELEPEVGDDAEQPDQDR